MFQNAPKSDSDALEILESMIAEFIDDITIIQQRRAAFALRFLANKYQSDDYLIFFIDRCRIEIGSLLMDLGCPSVSRESKLNAFSKFSASYLEMRRVILEYNRLH
jgi:hypothetical protein